MNKCQPLRLAFRLAPSRCRAGYGHTGTAPPLLSQPEEIRQRSRDRLAASAALIPTRTRIHPSASFRGLSSVCSRHRLGSFSSPLLSTPSLGTPSDGQRRGFSPCPCSWSCAPSGPGAVHTAHQGDSLSLSFSRTPSGMVRLGGC
jgi:hypothetical protein